MSPGRASLQPLSVQAPAQTGSRWTWKNRLVFLGLVAVGLVGLVALLATLRGGSQYEGGWKGARESQKLAAAFHQGGPE